MLVSPRSIVEILRRARQRLAEAGIDNAPLDARLLVEHASGTTQADSISRPELELGQEVAKAIDEAVARRIAGEPVHRILGFREFYGLRLSLSDETLEPRPDTETLVEAVLPAVRRIAAAKGGCTILDLGTGTGAVALALLDAVPRAIATGSDLSDDALETARKNAASLGLADRFQAVRSDWFAQIRGRWDAIVSNPPYIETETIGQLQREVRRFDPARALDGGADGLDAYRAIAACAHAHVDAQGIMAVEIGSTQKDAVVAIFERNKFRVEAVRRDLGGNDRALVFKPA